MGDQKIHARQHQPIAKPMAAAKSEKKVFDLGPQLLDLLTRTPATPPPDRAPGTYDVEESVEGVPSIRERVGHDHALLNALRTRVEAAVEDELAGTDWTARTCPWLEYWFAYYEARSPDHLEAALRKYTGGRGDLIDATVERVRRAVVRWRATGEIDAPHAAIPEPVEVLASLGPGQRMDPAVRGRMEAATGMSFSDARIHTDVGGARVASSESARAVAVGSHVAFGAGEYRPGTLEGDALLLHELSHTAQQRNATTAAGSSPAMEHAADRFAAAALSRSRGLGGAVPAPGHAPGLQLQRCDGKKSTPLAKDAGLGSGSGSAVVPVAPVASKLSFSPTGHDLVQKVPMTAIQPVDVAGSLVGELFELRGEETVGKTKLKAGTKVRPTMWNNAVPTVTVALANDAAVTFPVRKANLRPVAAKVGSIVRYQADEISLEKELALLTKRQRAVDRIDADTTYNNPPVQKKDHDQAAQLVADTEKALNEMLIKQQMFNRFDRAIQDKTAAANAKWGNKDPLDPNLVKSIIFRETQMGTFGAFLDDTTAGRPHETMNHWNITQAIDSSGEMYAHYMKQERPDLVAKYSLDKVISDERRDHTRFQTLRDQATRTPAQDSELAALGPRFTNIIGQESSEPYFYAYPNFSAAVQDLWGPGHLNETYEHWIEMMIFELFYKYKHLKGRPSWTRAVEAYNGQSSSYRDEVMNRLSDARKKADWYVPRHGGK